MKNNDHKLSPADLIQMTEKLLQKKLTKKDPKDGGISKSPFLHDLDVHHIEQKMQNEELLAAIDQTAAAIKNHADLYDFAPFGYFTLSREGKILGLNLYASQMLGEERSRFKDSLFSFFVSKETKPTFLHFLKKIYSDNAKASCEIGLVINGNLPLLVQLNGICIENGEQCLLTAIDISGRKLIKEAELKREQLFKTLAEVAPVGIFHTDATGYTTYVNPSWCQITGLSNEGALGNNWLNAVHPEDKKKIQKGWKKATKKQDISVTEYRFIRPDGSVTWVMGRAIPEKNLDGQILGYVGTVTDITERKLIEEKQLEYEAFFKETQVIANLGTYSLDIQSGKWTCSEVLNSIFGIDAAIENSLDYFSTIIHPDWQKTMYDYFTEEVFGKKKKFDFEYKIIRKNNQAERWVHGLGRLKFDRHNQPITMVGTIQDITSRKQMEIELSQAKEREEATNSKFKNYVENAPDGVFVADERGNYLEVNPAASLTTGYSKKELLGMSIKDLTPADSLETAFAHFQELVTTGFAKGEIKFLHKNGSERWWFVDSVQISEKEFLGFVKDITERKLSEAAIIKSNERFELIARATTDGLWDWNLETGQLWGNEFHQQLYGLTLADPIPSYGEWVERIHPDDREQTVRSFVEARASQRNSHAEEYRFYAEKLGWIYIYGRTLIERNREGKAVRLIGSMTNITENKKAEIALKNAEERLNFLLSATPAVIFSNQVEYPFAATFISENITEQTGYKPEEFLNDPEFWFKNVHPDDQPKVLENYKLIIEKGYHTQEYRFRLKNGSYLWIHDVVRLIFDTAGKPLEMVGYLIDIDERKKAEESIKASEEKYRQLFESSPLPMWVYDIESFQMLDVNEAAILHYGYSKAEFIGMNVLNLRPAEDVVKFLTIGKKANGELYEKGILRHKKRTAP